MDPNDCEDCRERTAKNKRGDWANPTGSPLLQFTDEGLEGVSDCKTSFREFKDYFSASLKRCRQCGTVWLLGYYEDFDGADVASEWGVRTWIWRPVTPEQIAAIEAADNTWSLDINTFATS